MKVGNAALDRHFFSRCANYQSVKVGNAALDRYCLSRGASYQSVKVCNAALDRHFYLEAGILVFECKQRRLEHTFLS